MNINRFSRGPVSRISRLAPRLAVGLETNSANWFRMKGLVRVKIATLDWVDDMWMDKIDRLGCQEPLVAKSVKGGMWKLQLLSDKWADWD